MNRAGEQVLLNDHLKLLRLPAMLRQYPECARQAREGKESHESFLLNLTTQELEQRQANQLKRRLQEAKFPTLKTLEMTDLNKWPDFDSLRFGNMSMAIILPAGKPGADWQAWHRQNSCGHRSGR